MNAFDQITAMPGLRSLFDIAWRLFGVNPALVSADGQRVVVFEPDHRSQPFCAALQKDAAGRALCAMCDQNRFLEARRSALALRYRCHAGLTEFVVPVIRDGEMIALLQCGQVHDRRPSAAGWRLARQDLVKAGITSRPLRRLFEQNRVLPQDRQGDLLNLLELIASRLAHADEQRLLPEPGRTRMQLGRAVTFVEVHLGERLALPVIAQAAGLSTRSLVRLFRKEVGTSVVEFILRRRIARARDLLRRTDRTCAEIAFEAGFGSVQHFNRIFRRHQDMSPARWRQRILAPAPPDRSENQPGLPTTGARVWRTPAPGCRESTAPTQALTRALPVFCFAFLAVASACWAAASDPVPEEFVGPFPSWRDLRRDYGAVGDGRADDTAALQRGLDDLTKHTGACVLYLPAGTYRLTGTVRTVRKAHTDCQGVAVVGEDPTRTILRWDGTNGGTMFQWDAWYSRISRLTFDGASRAGTALAYGPAFSTYNETSDLIFRDATHGLVFGGPDTAGQAENAVLRCQFVRCATGLQTVNWNSMDIWVWHGRFEDCGRGVHNVMGNWHVWESLFLRSRVADLSSINLMAFSVVNNTSVGSRCFFDFSTGHTWGSPVSLTGNRVLDPTGDWAVLLDNAGPYLVVDNQFRLGGAARAVRMTWADQTLVGNRYAKTNAVEERGRFRRLAERVVPAIEISAALPALPPAPPRRERKVFEVAAGADVEAIQQAIHEAAKLAGQRPVVHLPMGNYRIEKTLIIPAGSDLQLVGDSAGETGTRLNWSGPVDSVVLRLEGPTRATLRDFYIHAGSARALLVETCDQPGGRVFADQLNANGPGAQGSATAAAIRVHALDRTDVQFRALQGSGNAGHWVEVLGGPDADRATNEVSVFTGATGSAAGQYEVRHGGRLVVRGVYHERSSDSLNGLRLADRGTLSIDATRFSYATSATAPTVAFENFHGLFTLATCMLLPVETKESCRFELRGDGSGASVLALNNQFWIEQKTTADDVWRNLAQPPAHGGLIGCNINTGKKEAAPKGFEFLANIGEHPDPAKSASGAGPLQNRGSVDDATLLRHLTPLRATRVWQPDAPVPSGTTDVRLHRVMASGGHGAVVELRGQH